MLSRAWDKLGITEQTAFRIGSIRNSTFNSQLRNDSVFQGTGGKHRLLSLWEEERDRYTLVTNLQQHEKNAKFT